MTSPITLYHCPYSRSTGVITLLEELNAPYQLHVMNMKKGENREAAYLAVNPMGKVPAIRHDDAIITEQVAIYIYLADLFPAAGLAPPLGDALRGPYLRWMAFYGSCLEPALVDRWLKREVQDKKTTGYGTFDDVFTTFTTQMSQGPYMLGPRFTALDVLWGGALGWMTAFELLPPHQAITDYVTLVQGRPAAREVAQRDGAMANAQPG
nr:glutathione S-transferase [uncultured Duganella sp.]